MYILEEEFGNDGYAFWFKLLELLCRTEDHYMDCSDPTTWRYLLAKTRVNEISGEKILGILVFLGQIDKELWETRRIIWCQKLVDNFADVYSKRKRPLPLKPFTEHNSDNCPRNDSTSGFLSQKCEQTDISVPEMTQSKVNKSKVNKSKLNNTPLPPKGSVGAVVSSKGITDFVNTETGEILSRPPVNTPSLEIPEAEPFSNNSAGPELRPDNSFGEICKQYADNIGKVTGLVADGIRDWADNYPAEWIITAIKEAVLSNVRKPNYISAILDNWDKNGFKAVPQNKAAPPPDTNQGTTRANVENQISIRVRQEIVRNSKSGQPVALDGIRARVRREVEAEYAERLVAK
ncbi:MAG: hypothetical protein A9183_06915 [Dehalococcoides mccartyi]|uniref:DnaD domain protein n=1 Tax=Dehalococcoides mccartyi TaxID=61435 RepID=UPI000804DA8B|nr:DnaD domain protein [Dehalococcoides mccartyi]OBW62617.1 MAG: hypothetical protein A9183_06915 [Dehalococcoides mccartyi]